MRKYNSPQSLMQRLHHSADLRFRGALSRRQLLVEGGMIIRKHGMPVPFDRAVPALLMTVRADDEIGSAFLAP